MNNIPIRIHRGLFENRNIFNAEDRKTIFLSLSDTKFQRPETISDNKFEFHPDLYEESNDTKISSVVKEKCLTVLKSCAHVVLFCSSEMPGILNQTDQTELEVLRYFILEFKNENNDRIFNAGLNYHLDSNHRFKENVLSCVFTFRSNDCIGGGLNYSDENSGG